MWSHFTMFIYHTSRDLLLNSAGRFSVGCIFEFPFSHRMQGSESVSGKTENRYFSNVYKQKIFTSSFNLNEMM